MKTLMLKIGVVAGCFMLINLAVAQEKFHIGVQGVPQMSWMINQDDRDNSNFKYLPTFNGAAGITSQYDFNANIGIGLDVLYSLQGQRYELSNIERYKRTDYIKVPVMVVYSYELTQGTLLIGKIGPQASFITTASLLDKDLNKIVSDHKNAYEDFEFGGVAMGGIGVTLTENLMLDALIRYDFGFTDAENKDYNANFNNPTSSTEGRKISGRAVTNNSTAGISLGIKYVMTKK